MKQITLIEFLNGYEQGYITDVVAIGSKIYGKDPRGKANTNQVYDVVWANIV